MCLAMNPKQTAHKVLGRPCRECDATTGLQYSAHLRHGDIGPRGEHVTKLTEHDVKCCVGSGKTFGIAFQPSDIWQPGDPGVLTRHIEQCWSQVYARDMSANSSRRDRDYAGTCSNV